MSRSYPISSPVEFKNTAVGDSLNFNSGGPTAGTTNHISNFVVTSPGDIIYRRGDGTGNLLERLPIGSAGEVLTVTGAEIAEVTTITTVADVGDSLDGTYFLINSPTTAYYVWISTSGGSAPDPKTVSLANADLFLDGQLQTTVIVSITTGDSAGTIAGLLRTALLGTSDFTIPIPGATTLTITNSTAGAADNAADGTTATGFTIGTTIPGVSIIPAWAASGSSGSSGSPGTTTNTKSVPLNFRFNDPSGNPTTVNSTTYSALSTMYFRGTGVGDTISSIFGIANVTNGNARGQMRLFDFTNGLVIVETPAYLNRTKDAIPFISLGQSVSAYVAANATSSTVINATATVFANLADPVVTTTPPTSFVISNVDGGSSTPEFVTIDTTSSTPTGIDGRGFTISFGTASTDYFFFWYDVDDSGTSQPADPGAGGGTIVEITTVNTGDSDEDIAKKTTAAINSSANTGSTIKNIPTQPALLEIQMRRVNTGGGGSSAIHSLQIYG